MFVASKNAPSEVQRGGASLRRFLQRDLVALGIAMAYGGAVWLGMAGWFLLEIGEMFEDMGIQWENHETYIYIYI